MMLDTLYDGINLQSYSWNLVCMYLEFMHAMAILTLFGHEKVKEGGGKKQKQYCRCGMENNLVFLSN